MFGWFERRLNPFPSEVPDTPPRGLFAFIGDRIREARHGR